RALVGVAVVPPPVVDVPPPVAAPAAVAPPENGSRPGKTLKFVSWPSRADGGMSVSTSSPGAAAPAPGVEGAEPGVGAAGVVVGAAAVGGGGVLPPVSALNVFGPCQAM